MSRPLIVNDAVSGEPLVRWRELAAYHDFLLMLVWRELYLRYRHTAIGVGWSFLHPLLTMAVFVLIVPSLVSHEKLMASTGGIPYPVFVYCGMAPWACFAHALTRCNTTLVDQHALIKNMYFPLLVLPLAKVLAALAELMIGLVVLFIMMAVLGVRPSVNLLFLPALLAPLLLVAFGGGLILSTLQVRYRDIFYLVQFGLQMGLLVTPVWFPLSAMPERTRWLLALNPMAGIVQGFRWAVLGLEPPAPGVMAVSVVASLVLLIAGLVVFRARQATVADYV